MSKLEGNPNWGIVGRLKPPLDFYKWKGIWCARYYPEHIKQPGTEAQILTWKAMLSTVDDWNAQAPIDKKAWKHLVRDANRTGRDFHGRLHLKDQIRTEKPWVIYLLESVTWDGDRAGIWFKSSRESVPQIDWCFDDENKRAYWWYDIGYCIRGRKWTRKFKLYENWKYKHEWDRRSGDDRYREETESEPEQKKLYFTIRLSTAEQENYRGRSGVYVFNKGENYP